MNTAFKQGQLDSLCGIYAIVNAVHSLQGTLSRADAQELFQELIVDLDELDDSTAERVVDGMSVVELSKGLHCAAAHYDICWKRPFVGKQADMKLFWQYMRYFIKMRGAVILDVTDKHGKGHWTVVERVEGQTLYLLDSGRRQQLGRRHCTVDKSEAGAKFYITVQNCFFVEITKGDLS